MTTNTPSSVSDEEVERAVEAWHDSKGKSLHDWLGWSWEEYAEWVRDPSAIPRAPKHFATMTDTRVAEAVAKERAEVLRHMRWWEEQGGDAEPGWLGALIGQIESGEHAIRNEGKSAPPVDQMKGEG